MSEQQEKNQKDPSRIDMNQDELDRLVKEIRSSNLSAETGEVLVRIVLGWCWVSQQLEQKKLSLKKMIRLFFGSKTEKEKRNKGNKPKPPPSPDESKSDNGDRAGKGNTQDSKAEGQSESKAKGHGKNGQAQFSAAERVAAPHPTLKPGDRCPACEVAKLYDYGPSSVLRFFGQPPITASVYEVERLRCASCQELFTAELPPEAGADRHHVSAKAMVALLTSGAGLPAYRLESLQAGLGVPLADSTQFDIREDVANAIKPLHACLEGLAANGSLLHNDDTPNKILELMKENKTLPEDARRGMQTTGIVAFNEGHRIALFSTGRAHAGENLGKLMQLRDENLPTPLQMGDAAPLNVPAAYADLLVKCLCLDHGRRNFFELLTEFKGECRHVVDELAKIYMHDAEAKRLLLKPAERLAYHQERSGPVMNALNAWMEEKFENREVEPNSNLGKAVAYFLKHWNGLTQFLRIEGAPLSNAEVERLLKKCVLRRKVSMFYKTQVGAWIGDVLMSVIETARMNGANIFDYLVALQTHAARVRLHPELWLPWNFQLTLASI